MVREMNNDFINRTTDWLPEHRKGPLGDPLKVNCGTCHQGAYQPLLGANMIRMITPTLHPYDEAPKAAYVDDAE